jgi:hypothetical protein
MLQSMTLLAFCPLYAQFLLLVLCLHVTRKCSLGAQNQSKNNVLCTLRPCVAQAIAAILKHIQIARRQWVSIILS